MRRDWKRSPIEKNFSPDYRKPKTAMPSSFNSHQRRSSSRRLRLFRRLKVRSALLLSLALFSVACASPGGTANAGAASARSADPEETYSARTLETSTPMELLRQGNACLKDGRDSDALLAYECAWNKGARAAELETTIARLWLQIGDPEAALSWAARAPSGEKPDRLALLRARALLRMGSVESARKNAASAAQSDDRETAGRARLMLGRLASQAGDEDRAEHEYSEAARLGVSNPGVHLFLGARAYNRKSWAKAVRHLSLAGELSPRFQLALAGALLESGESDKARRALVRYVEMNGMDTRACDLAQRLP